MATSETIRMIIQAKDAASPAIKRATRAFQDFDRGLRRLPRLVLNLKSAFAGLGAAYVGTKMTQSLLDTASGFERIQTSLDTITKGQGDEWFRRLNEWALKMPVNTEQAIDAFRSMRAMGLTPTIADMTTLVDTMGALGGNEGTLQSIARALGQIQTKGKVSAEELLQLAEQGIPAYEILGEKLGLTKEQLGNIGNEGLDAGKAVRALLEGMADRFGGQSEKMQNTFSGLMESLKSYWKEFTRRMMEVGAFDGIKAALKSIVDQIDDLRASGKFEEWARSAGRVATGIVARIIEAIGRIPGAFRAVQRAVYLTGSFFQAMGAIVIDIAAVIAASLNPVWAVQVAVQGFRKTFPILAEMRDNIDAAGQRFSDLANEAENGEKRAGKFARAAKNLADQVRGIPDTKDVGVNIDVKNAIDALFASRDALDAFEKKAKEAYSNATAEAKKHATRIAEIEEEIRIIRMDTEDQIRAIRQKAMSDEQAWADQRKQAEEKISAARKALAEGDKDLAESLLGDARSIAAGLATEVSRTVTDVTGKTKEQVVVSMKEAAHVAEGYLRQIGDLRIQTSQKELSAEQAAQDALQKTAADVESLLATLSKRSLATTSSR